MHEEGTEIEESIPRGVGGGEGRRKGVGERRKSLRNHQRKSSEVRT